MAIDEPPPLRGISSMASRGALAELADVYRRQAEQRVVVEFVGGVDAARRVIAAEPFDFVVLATDAIDALAAAGRIDPTGRIDLARSGIAIAIKQGSTRPDVRSESAVRDAVVDARRIGYSTGPSGVYLVRLFERWGIADAVASRIVQAPPGVPVATLIARGDVDLGFQQLSELIDVTGIEVVGVLPAEIQLVTVFSAALCTASHNADATRRWLDFLASRDADAAKRRHGMEPAR